MNFQATFRAALNPTVRYGAAGRRVIGNVPLRRDVLPGVFRLGRARNLLAASLMVAAFSCSWPVCGAYALASPAQTETGKGSKDQETKGKRNQPGRKSRAGAKGKGRIDRGAGSGGRQNKTRLSPELQKQIDRLLEEQNARLAEEVLKRAKRSRADKSAPTQPGAEARSSRPGADRPGDESAGRSTMLNIPPDGSDVPPEERKYRFSIKEGTYEQLVDAFARMTGLGVVGETPKDGKVSFVSTEELTFDEALARVRMLLFKYKPLEPYWLLRRKTHLEVIRVNDIYRILPRDRMFKSVEEFRAAGLRNEDLALVIYTPKSGSYADLRVVRDFMPDYVRVAPLGGSSVTIFALVKDINKYLDLIPVFVGYKNDPRTLTRIEVVHVPPSEALEKLRGLMDLGGGGGRPRPSVRSSRGKEISPLDTMREPEVTMLPDDAQGVLIVRAMQDKIDEIKRLLPFIDVDTSMHGLKPVVIPVENADPEELVGTIQQVLAAVSPSAESGGVKTTSSRRKTTRARSAAAPLVANGITLLVHPSGGAIIVIADEEDVKRVRELVKEFDVAGGVGPIRIPVTYADPGELTTTITTVLSGSRVKVKGQPDRFRVVREPNGSALWYSGPKKDLERVRELVSLLDVPGQAPSLRVVRLLYQQPSFVANILRELDKQAGTAASGGGGASKRARSAAGASRFTPNDDQNVLFILCTDSEWKNYDAVIQQLEAANEAQKPFVRVALDHLDPQEAVERLALLLSAGGRQASANLLATDGGILVLNANDAQLERINALLAEIDRPVEIVQRTFEISHRTPDEIKTAVETLVGGQGGGAAGRRHPERKGAAALGLSSRPRMTIVQLGNNLVVRATPEKMKEVASLIEELDVEEGGTELRVYDDFPPSADIANISEALSSVFSGRVAPRRPKAGPLGTGEGARFLPQPAAGKLVVIAPPDMFPDIEELLDALRGTLTTIPRELEFIDVEFADPDELVEQIRPLLDLHVRELIDSGELRSLGESRPGAPKTVARRPGQRADTGPYYHLAPDVRNHRIVVAAPKAVTEYARKLVASFDKAGAGKDVIVRTVLLDQADASEMVRVIREMMGMSARVSARRPKAAGTAEAGAPSLAVVEGPGGGAVVLRGTEEDVDQAVGWIEQLDAISTRGRSIKVYRIEYADIKALGDLIMNVVAGGPTGGRPTPGRAPRVRKGMEPIEEEDEFELTKTWTGQDIYIRADLITDTMIVAASEGKIAEVDDIVARFNAPPADGEQNPLGQMQSLPSFMYELRYADAMDAAFELETILAQLWNPPDEVPQVESAMFGNFLIVKYPHEDRFPEIKELIRKYVDKRPEEYLTLKRRGITAPAGMSALDTARWIKMNHPEIEIEIVDETPSTDETFNLEQVKPAQGSRASPCVLPLALARQVSAVIGAATAQQEPEPQDRKKGRAAGRGRKQDEQPESLLESAAKALLDAADAPGGEDAPGEKLRIRVNNNTGDVVIEGPAGVLEDVPDWMDELEEEIEKLKKPPDIRVIRVRYIDVYSAAEIIEEMFNATRQQRQAVEAARRRQQQLLRQQQQQRQRQQQQKQAGQQSGQPQRPGQRGQAPLAAVPQLPEPAVRVFPNPRDRTLILRAETNQYAAIFELLATIDQPQPIDSELRIFKLAKLNAAEVEEVLKEMLGLDRKASGAAARSRGGRRRAQAGSARGASGGQLPQTVLQPTVSGTNMLGVDAKDIKLSSNEASNTIVVMAPKNALDFIGNLIKQLESEEIPERLTRYYELKQTKVEEVADYLESHFDAGRRPGKTGKGPKGSASVASLNTPSFVPYPRLNMLTVLATAEQLEEIDAIVKRLDVSGDESKWQDVTLRHADAGTVADTLTQMFGGGAGRSRGKIGVTAAGASEARFIGEEGGRMLLFNAPEGLRGPILATIEKLESQAKGATAMHIIKLKYATPSKVADAIESAYAGGRTGRPGRRASRTRFTLTAHDPSKQLFVQADDETFKDIESLLATLDKPADIGFEFRVYPLQYANARQVHAQMTKLMTDYLKRLGPAARDAQAFSVEVDDRANALVVLGSPAVFGFLEENLPKIDGPANAVGPVSSLTVALKNSRAQEVAATINRLYGQQRPGSVETPPRAESNRSLNLLIVRGTQRQLEEIRKEVIEPLEEHAAAALSTETIKLQHADAEAVAEAVNRFFEDKQRAYKSMGSAASVSPADLVAVVTPDVNTREVIIQAGEENMKLAKARIAQLDREEVAAKAATTVKIYSINYADPDAIVRIINEWGRSRPQARKAGKGGRTGDLVNASAEPVTGSVVVTAGAANHLIIQQMIEGLDKSEGSRQEVHVLNLDNADAESVARTLNDIFVKSAPRSGGRVPPASISAVQGSKAILVKCKDELFADVQAVVAELDRAEALLGETVGIVPLLYADAGEVEAALREYLQMPGRRGGRGAELAGGTRLSVLTQSNAIVVSGDKQSVARLEELAKQLDSSGEKGSVPQIIRLKHAGAGQLASMLGEMFAEQRGGRRGQAPPVIKANEAIEALIVRASPTDFAAIEAIVEQLDTEEAALQKNFRIVQVGTGINVTDMAEKIEQAINEGARAQAGKRRGGEIPSIRVSPDTRTGSLIVSGNPVLFDEAEEMTRALEKMGPPGGRNIKILSVKNVPTEDIERLIALLKGEESSVKGRSKRARGSRPRRRPAGRGK